MKKNVKPIRQSFAKGTATIMIAMLMVKILGGIFKIPLLAILGGEGYGYFSSAYNLYNPIYALSTIGLPLAVSRMVSQKMAENKFKDVEKIRKTAASIFIVTGIIGTVLMLTCAVPFSKSTNSPNVIYSIFLLSPTVFFVCLMSIYKGYYQGLRNMRPTAISEVIEAAGKVIFGLTLSYVTVVYANNEFKSKSTVFGIYCESQESAQGLISAFAAAGAILGITIAAAFGFIYIFVKHIRLGNVFTKQQLLMAPESESKKAIIKKLLKLAVPIGLGSIILNLSGVIDSIFIQNRLNHIMQSAPWVVINQFCGAIPQRNIDMGTVHVFLWGCFGTMTTITMLIPTFLQGVSINALPMLTEAIVKKEKQKIRYSIESIFKLTTLFTIPCGLGLSVLSHPILNLLYGTSSEAYVAAQIMRLAGITIIFVSISTPLCSILQAAGRPDITLKLLSVGLIIKVILNYTLVSIPEINIQGANIGTLVCYAFICIMLLYSINKITGVLPNLMSTFLKPLLCSLCCIGSAYLFYKLLSNIIMYKFATIIAILVAIVVYLLTLCFTKTIDRSDLKMLPIKGKLLNFLYLFIK